MKYYLFLIYACIYCFIGGKNLLAQDLEFELLLRPALTSLRGNDMVEDHFDPAIYPSFGLGVTRLFTNRSLIHVAVLYDMKGGRNEEEFVFRNDANQPIGTQVVKTRSDFQYITIPIQCGKRFGTRVKYQLGLGIYSAFLLKQELTTEYDGYAGSLDMIDSFKDVDIGLSASFSVHVPLKKNWPLKAGLDDYVGVFDAMKADVEHEGSTKHNSLGFVVGLNCRLDKTKG